jgi:hypothetical protein
MTRFILLVLFFYLAFRLIRFILGQARMPVGHDADRPVGEIDNVMIQDPWCRVYFQKKEGVRLRHRGKDLYFCSAECRDKYLESGDSRGDGEQPE